MGRDTKQRLSRGCFGSMIYCYADGEIHHASPGILDSYHQSLEFRRVAIHTITIMQVQQRFGTKCADANSKREVEPRTLTLFA
jgi:hypothetical protein